jgi:CDP-4-dehydro-6-deoxyglucose reductase
MAQQAASDKCRVTVANTGQSFECPPGELILDAGLAAGIGLPHNCRGGACGTCKSEVLEGAVDHGWVMTFAISDEEKAQGKCLICQSKPLTGTLVIRTDNAVAGAEDTPPAPIEATARILAAEPLTPSIRRLVLALPREVRFRYRAGQHVELKTPGVGKARTYSIANAPDREGLPPDGLLEFFVTRHANGQASGWLHEPGRLGGALALHGPYGSFHLPKDLDQPLLCLAGGSGLAPILAILRQALGTGFARPVQLVLSVRDRSEVFGLDALHALARRHPNFSYLVSLTRATQPEPSTGWRSGRIDSWLGQEFFDLSGHCVLAAGPPGFVDAAIAKAKELGARPERILTDSFTPTVG